MHDCIIINLSKAYARMKYANKKIEEHVLIA